jgi:hypothetical protein
MIWFIVHLFQFLRVFKYSLFLNEYLLHLMLIKCSILINNIPSNILSVFIIDELN